MLYVVLALSQADTPTLTASIMEQQEKKRTEDPKKDTSELGMEVVEYLSTAAGGPFC